MSRHTLLSRSLFGAGLLAASFGGHAAAILMSTDGQSASNNAVAGTLGHTVSTNTLAGISGSTAAALAAFDVIFINPNLSVANYTTLQGSVATGGALDQYASNGGTLVLDVAGNNGNQLNIAPGGLDYDRTTTHNAETFTSPSHAYLTGAGYGGAALSSADFNAWGSTDHGWFTGLLAGTSTVLNTVDGASWVQYNWGAGNVIATTLTYGWGTAGAKGAAQSNLINYAASISAPSAVPVPSSVWLLGAGMLGLLGWQRRRS